MFGLGLSELLIILILVIFFCGGKKLPQIGEGLGRMVKEFRKASRPPAEAKKVKTGQRSQFPDESQPSKKVG